MLACLGGGILWSTYIYSYIHRHGCEVHNSAPTKLLSLVLVIKKLSPTLLSGPPTNMWAPKARTNLL